MATWDSRLARSTRRCEIRSAMPNCGTISCSLTIPTSFSHNEIVAVVTLSPTLSQKVRLSLSHQPQNERQIRNAALIAAGLALEDKDASVENDGMPATLTTDHFRSVRE
ncbi:hypothetical protein AUP68_03409 [Ilyonectria robusta]